MKSHIQQYPENQLQGRHGTADRQGRQMGRREGGHATWKADGRARQAMSGQGTAGRQVYSRMMALK